MEKLVEANSFPNVEVGDAVEYTDKPDQPALSLALENTGVGPARIETLELWEKGSPIRSAADLGAAIKAAHGGGQLTAHIEGGSVLGNLLGAGKTKTVVRFKLDGQQKWFPVLSKVVFGLQSRICYCSVFDECHISDSRVRKGRPFSVKQCPIPPTSYDDDLSKLVDASGGGVHQQDVDVSLSTAVPTASGVPK